MHCVVSFTTIVLLMGLDEVIVARLAHGCRDS